MQAKDIAQYALKALMDGGADKAKCVLVSSEKNELNLEADNINLLRTNIPYKSNDKKNITYKSDFFSLGTLIYELLTGSNPYAPTDGMAWGDILANVTQLVPPDLISLGICSDNLSIMSFLNTSPL